MYEPFTVKTAHGATQGEYSTLVPCGELFKTRNLSLKFNVFQFHSKFDLLLGLDNLKKIKASVNLNTNTIQTDKVEIPIQYLNSKCADLNLIDARSVQQIRVRVKNVENGEAVIPYLKIGHLEVPECLINIKDHETYVNVLNPTEKPAQFSQIAPLEVEEIGDIPDVGKFENLNHYFEENFDREFDISKIRLNHLNSEEKDAITKLVLKYPDIFHIGKEPLSSTSNVKHQIRTTDEVPVYARNYRFPEIYRKEVDRQIEEMLAQGIVKHSDSPWNAPIWIVPKKSDASGVPKFRVVIDYRKLNEKTIEDKYPLPQISDLLDRLGRCQYFSVIDLKSGFHQIEMHEDSIAKTAFSTPNYHLEFRRLPFGLKNSPSTFQRMMDNVLRGISNEFCCVYLDDIIIFSTSLQEHLQRLEAVFKRLRKANLKIQLDKTEFLRSEISYLGHVITPEGVKPNPDKIQAILEYPIPTNTRQIKSFLGLLGYYRRFIRDFAKVTKPMTRRLKKDTKINIEDPDYAHCFKFCKHLLTNDPILQYPDFSKPFHLTTDASNVAVGAVLSQTTKGADLPIAYASRTLNESEQRLATIEKELLAIVWAVQYFRPYLYGRKFKIITDHRPLQWLQSIKEPSSKLFKWRTKLAAYDFDIEYKKGSLNTNADALSRIEILNNNDETDNLPSDASSAEIDQAMAEFYDALTPNTKTLIDQLDPDENLDKGSLAVDLYSNPDLDEDDDSMTQGTVHSNAIGHAIVTIPIRDEPINTCNHQILVEMTKLPVKNPIKIEKLFGTKTQISIKLSHSNFEEETVKFVKEYLVPKIKYGIHFSEDVYEKFVRVMTEFFTFSELSITKFNQNLPNITKENEQLKIVKTYHEGPNNHRGIDETHWQIKQSMYWPNMRETIQRVINNCEVCTRCKYDRNPIKVKYNITPTASKPLETIHLDTLTLDGRKFLTIIDSFSRFGQAYPLNSSNAVEIVNALVQHFSHHGTPQNIVTDNGPEFQNALFREFLLLQNINIHFTASQHPESNGIIERFHSTLIEHIRILKERKEFKDVEIQTKVNYAILAYNNSAHSASKTTPFYLLYGHMNPQTLLDINVDEILTNNYLNRHKEKMKIIYQQTQEMMQENKLKTMQKLNEDREDPPPMPTEVFVKTVQKQSKTKPKFQKETIHSVNPETKTAEIIPRHHNTQKKIHISNVKRPKLFTDSVLNAWDDKLNKNETLIRKFNLEMKRQDLLTLKGNQWLNDMIVNFYFELINQRNRENDKLPKVHCFNSFLYTSFVQGGYARVKNYSRQTDIFDKDILVFPIFLNNHWRLVVVKFRTKRIFYLDSLSKVGRNILNSIKDYLIAEHRNKKGKPLDFKTWDCGAYPNTPQQSNGNDCGVFMCQFAKLITANQPVIVPQKSIPELRKQMCSEILKGELIQLLQDTGHPDPRD